MIMSRQLQRLRRYGLAATCLALATIHSPLSMAQAPEELEPLEEELLDGGEDEGSNVSVIPPQEPMSLREELFLAIELRDLEAARAALVRGAESEISRGDPSPLATAALHDNLRLVMLLLDFGGDPAATLDSPLEEAVRNENSRMVELLMRAGARVPEGPPGQELFRLAQRGGAGKELSRILLDHGAGAGQCLAAATAQARVELMKYCLRRGADPSDLPAGLNPLEVALASGNAEAVDMVLAGGVTDPMLSGAFTEAVAAGRMELVERALTAGAVPAFEQVEAAIEGGQPEMALFLLDQSHADDATALEGGDAAALRQRAADLGFAQVAAALKDRTGSGSWEVGRWLPIVLGVVTVAGLIWLLAGRRGRRPARAVTVVESSRPERPVSSRPAGPRPAGPRPAGPRPAGPAVRREPEVAGTPDGTVPSPGSALPDPVPARAAEAPAAAVTSPETSTAATRPIGAIPMMPQVSAGPETASPPSAASPVAGSKGGGWHVAPEPAAAPELIPEPVRRSGVPPVANLPPPAVELRMPEVDLARDADAVFDAARAASSGETVRPDAPDRAQVALVTPARVTLLQSCPAPGSLAPEQLAAAERLAGGEPARNVAVIAYTDLDAMSQEIQHAIPFFELLRQLGYLGHAVWIFEGHVSAMAAGCQDADLLIVDDGMMPYLPGNWRSVATRVMRGSDIHLFERKTGALRRLS